MCNTQWFITENAWLFKTVYIVQPGSLFMKNRDYRSDSYIYLFEPDIFFCLCRFDRKEVAEVNKIHQCVTKIIAIHAQAVSNQGYGQQMNYFTTSYLRNIFLKLSYIIHRRRLYKIILNCF